MANSKRSRTGATLTHWSDFRLQLFVEGILIGIVAGIVVVLYRILLEDAEALREQVYHHLQGGNLKAIVLWFMFLIVIAYILGLLVKFDPMVSGSGIPQIKGLLASQLKMNWLRTILGKFIGGILAVGTGLSLGREGPSIQLGSAVGQGVSRLLGRLKIEEKYLITSGASAGLAAAFNAPLAGVIFALEEMHKNFSPLVLTSAMAASLSADVLSQRFFGQTPIFNFYELPTLPLDHYFYLIILGLIIGVFGVVFNWTLVKTLEIYEKQSWLKPEFRPVFAIILAGILGFFLPEVLGGGHHIIDSLDEGTFSIKMLGVLILVKFLFTMISYGSGVPGGIFLPLLVIGALSGSLFGYIVNNVFQVDASYISNFIVLAMAAYFTAIVKAPITGSILITEMTGSFNHLLALTTISMTAYLVTDILKSKPIYDVLLHRMILKKVHQNYVGQDKTKIILEIPVCLGSTFDGKRVKDIHWPPYCLLVGLKRGEMELIPKGDTLIHVGDYLIVLTNENHEAEAKELISNLAGECILNKNDR